MRRRRFVLPASTKTFVKRDDSQQLIAFCPRQIQFRRKKLLLRALAAYGILAAIWDF